MSHLNLVLDLDILGERKAGAELSGIWIGLRERLRHANRRDRCLFRNKLVSAQLRVCFLVSLFAVVLLQHISRFQDPREGLLVANWFVFLGHDFFFHQPTGGGAQPPKWRDSSYFSARSQPISSRSSGRGPSASVNQTS